MRVLIDSNVYISAIASGGNPAKACTLASEYEIIGCHYIIEEVYRILLHKFHWQETDVQSACHLYFSVVTLVEPSIILPVVRDPKDNPIMACAITAGADYLVTGDKDLLTLSCHTPRIVTPMQFIDSFKP